MIPVFVIDDYVITFEAQAEDISAFNHFHKECGWTKVDAMRISKYPFFCAHVQLFKDGIELSDTYLGCCSYKKESEFYKEYKSDYFADMVNDCFVSAGLCEMGQRAFAILRAN